MGMFDDIKYNGVDYQTKDFECVLHQYEIRDNRLYRQKWREVPLAEKEWVSFGVLKGEKLGYWKETQAVKDGEELIPFHGYLNFYGTRKENGKWEEFNAKFTDGLMVEIRDLSEPDFGGGEG